MKNAVSYVRVSSDDQAKSGFSIPQQITNNMNFAVQNGYKIDKTFKDEGISAKDLNRPALQDLLAYCMDKSNNVEAVVVWKLDRISRSIADYSATLEPFFKENNIKLLTVTDINGDGLDVEMMRQISMVFAERERKTAALRTKEGIRGKVATGQYPNHPPYGYKNIEKPGSRYKEMVLDEESAFFVRQAFTMCLNGDSSRTIASKLYKMGFRNKKGNKVCKSSIDMILRRFAYTGKFYYDGNLVEGTYPPIIDEATFYAAQKRLDTPNKGRQTHTEFPYNGCITCAKCGCYFTGERHKKTTKNGGVKYYIHYHCTGNRGGDCKKDSYINEIKINEAFTNILKLITVPEETKQLVIDGLKKVHAQQNSSYETQKKIIRKRIDKIDKMLKEAFESGFGSSESLKSNIQEWETERRTLILEEQEMLKATKTFFERSNSLLDFCVIFHAV